MYKNQLLIFIILVLTLCNCNDKEENIIDNKINSDYLVPNEETAIKIAKAILLPIYGKSIYDDEPFKVKLINDTTYYVSGTLKNKYAEEGDVIVGGVPFVYINRKNCMIIEVSHGK